MRINAKSLSMAIALVFITCHPESGLPQNTPKYAHHYAFILDTSGSMEGRVPGSSKVFPDVKAALNRFVDSLFLSEIDAVPTKAFVYTFDTGIQTRFDCEIRSDNDRRKLRDYINALTATGQNTYIYSSFRDAFREVQAKLNEVRLQPPNEHIVSYYLFTDGLDNSRSGPTFGDVLSDFSLRRNPQDFVFYCMLNIDPPASDQKTLAAFPELIAPIKKLDSPWQVVVKPSLIHLGNLWGKKAVTRRVVLTSANRSQSSIVKLNVKAVFPQLDSLGLGLLMQVKPNEISIEGDQDLTFEIENLPEELSLLYRKEDYSGALALTTTDRWGKISPSDLTVKFTFAPPCTLTLSTDNEPRIDFDEDSVWAVVVPSPARLGVNVRRNVSAADRMIGLNLSVTPKDKDELSSSKWDYLSKTLTIEGAKQTEAVIEDLDDVIDIGIVPDRDVTEEIQIDLVMKLTSPQATLAWDGESQYSTVSNQIAIPLSVFVPGKPYSPLARWLVYLGILLSAVILVFSVYKVVIKDELPWETSGMRRSSAGKVTCQLLNVDTGEDFDLTSLRKKRISLGKSGSALTNFDGQAELFMQEGRLMLEVKSGAVSWIDPTTHLELPINHEVVDDGRVFKFGNEKIQFRTNVANL